MGEEERSGEDRACGEEGRARSEKYPFIQYTSTSVQAVEKNQYRVSGMLQIRDVRRPVEVRVRRAGSEFTGLATFRMTKFGLKPLTAALGLVGTKDEMEFQFTLAVTPE